MLPAADASFVLAGAHPLAKRQQPTQQAMILSFTDKETSMIYMIVYSSAVVILSFGVIVLFRRRLAYAVVRQDRLGMSRAR